MAESWCYSYCVRVSWVAYASCRDLRRCLVWLFFFFFKQKTAYEIVSRDWSSDVCSSDLPTKVKIADLEVLLFIFPHCSREKRLDGISNHSFLDRKSVV